MSHKILSICIPTYNRAQHLDKLLLNISKFDVETLKKVEICISNNASTDNTESVIKKYIQNFEIKYFSQEKNTGSNHNIIFVGRMASCNSILITGDDDLINPSALNRVLNKIDQIDQNPIFILNQNKIKNLTIGRITARKFKSYILKYSFNSLGFLGNYIFPRSIFQNFPTDLHYIDKWPHLGALMYALDRNEEFFFIPDQLIIQAPDPTLTWTYQGWVEVKLKQIMIISNGLPSSLGIFRVCLTLRMILNLSLFKSLILWKLQHHKGFDQELRKNLKNLYFVKGNEGHIIKLVLSLYRLSFKLLPKKLLMILFKIFGRQSTLDRLTQMKLDPTTDGTERG
jgi:glycosyltransferase involved in cell wall biosynthesis